MYQHQRQKCKIKQFLKNWTIPYLRNLARHQDNHLQGWMATLWNQPHQTNLQLITWCLNRSYGDGRRRRSSLLCEKFYNSSKKKIERNISKKSSGDEIYKKSLNRFFQECYQIIKTLDFARIKCFVIASPGFINDQLLRYIKLEL